jgi:MtN3 and saliva related transmembrane protein
VSVSAVTVEAIGLAAGFCTSISSIPQIVKVIRSKSAGDLSLVTLGLFSFGSVLWIVYGVGSASFAVTLWNAVTLALYLLLIGVKIVHDTNKNGAPPKRRAVSGTTPKSEG